jgi:hypothetical protein
MFRSLKSTLKPSDMGIAMAFMLALTGVANAQNVAEAQTQSPPLFSSSQQLFEASKSGKFIGLYMAPRAEQAVFARSVLQVLNKEFNVPEVSKQCFESPTGFSADAVEVFAQISLLKAGTLSDSGPTFETPPQEWLANSVARKAKSLQSDAVPASDPCSVLAGGKRSSHPYRAELVRLGKAYAEATQVYVAAERGRRASDYEARQNVRVEAESKRIADAEERRQTKERIRTGSF